jgi:hypothetical protein
MRQALAGFLYIWPRPAPTPDRAAGGRDGVCGALWCLGRGWSPSWAPESPVGPPRDWFRGCAVLPPRHRSTPRAPRWAGAACCDCARRVCMHPGRVASTLDLSPTPLVAHTRTCSLSQVPNPNLYAPCSRRGLPPKGSQTTATPLGMLPMSRRIRLALCWPVSSV